MAPAAGTDYRPELRALTLELKAIADALTSPQGPHTCTFQFLRSERQVAEGAGEEDGFGNPGKNFLWYDVYSCTGCPSYRYIRQPRIPADFLGAKVFTLRPRVELRNAHGELPT